MKRGIAKFEMPSGKACANSSSIASISSIKVFLWAPTPFSWITPNGCFSSLHCKEIRRFFNVWYALWCDKARPLT